MSYLLLYQLNIHYYHANIDLYRPGMAMQRNVEVKLGVQEPSYEPIKKYFILGCYEKVSKK